MSDFKVISQQTFYQILGKVISSSSTFILLLFITRFYQESGTGIFTLILIYLAFFSFSTDLGLNAHLLPDFLKSDIETIFRKLLGTRILIASGLTIISTLIVLFWPDINSDFKLGVLIGSISIFQSAIFYTAAAIFQAKHRYDLYSLIWGLSAIFISLFVYLLAINNSPIYHLFWGYFAGWFISIIITLYFTRQFINNLLPIFDLNFVKKIFVNVWPISLTLILNSVYFRIDSFLLSGLKSLSDVGVYNLSYTIFQTSLVLPVYITNSYYPLMLKNLSVSQEGFLKGLKKVLSILLIISILGILLMFIFADPAITLVAGSNSFVGSAETLKILSLSYPAFFLSSVFLWTLISLKKYQEVLIIYIVGILLNLVLNIVFIPRYTYLGAAFVTGVSEYLILILQLTVLTYHYKVKK